MLTRLCCMRLKTAGIILGWLGIIGWSLLVILVSSLLVYSASIAQYISLDMDRETTTYDEIHEGIVVGCSIFLGMILLNLLSSIMLLLGTMKQRHLMLIPWLISSAIGMAFSVLYNLAILTVITAFGASLGRLISFIIPNALMLGLQIYIYMGIYALFKQIQRTRKHPQPLSTTTPQCCENLLSKSSS